MFVSEHVPDRHIGFACGTLTAGLTSGILLGSLTATLINSVFTPAEVLDWAWRLPFLLGGVFGLCAVYLRRMLHETPVFTELQQRKSLADELPLKTVLREHRGSIVLSMLLTWVLSAAIVVVILMTPTLLQTLYGFDAATVLKANSLAIVCLSVACVAAGAIVDRVGAGVVLLVGGLLLGFTAWTFYSSIQSHPDWLFPLYAVTGLLVGTIGAVPFVMVNAFPAVVRFSGLSFSYNVAYAIFGGLTPLVVSLMVKWDPMGPAYYVVALCGLSVVIGAYLRRQGR